MTPIARIPAIAAVLLLASHATAQSGKLEPARPILGQLVRVSYDTGHAGAALAATDRILAELVFSRPDKSEVCILVEMAPGENGVREGQAEVPRGAAVLQCSFFDPSKRIEPAQLIAERIVAPLDARPGVPAPGAVALEIPKRFPTDDLLEAELARYPDAVQVFATRWDAMTAARDRGKISGEEFEALVRKDLTRLEGLSETEGILSQLPYGYALIGDSAAAASSLRRLMERHPDSLSLRDTALFTLWATLLRRSMDSREFAEIRDMLVEHCARHPASPVAITTWRDTLGWGLPFEASASTFRACQREDPDHPDALLALAIACEKAGGQIEDEQIEAGIDAARRAAAAYASGERRLRRLLGPKNRVDCDGSLSERSLPESYAVLASLLLRAGRWQEAIEAARAVRSCPGVRVLAVAASWVAEGRALLEIGREVEGEEALLRAHLGGAEEASEVLRARHAAAGGDPAVFQQTLAARVRLIDLADGKPLPKAPALAGTTLNGLVLSPEALRGKVVVLNFWFLACAPCRAEMPALNRLVEAYRGQDDVLFLAVATDSESKLREFLTGGRFQYQIVSDQDRSLCREFGVSAYPTHVVMTPDGHIAHTLVGACHDPLAVLGPMIEWSRSR